MQIANASIYTPQNESLEDKIRAFKKVFQDFENIEACLKAKNQSDSLGTPEEISQAHKIAQNSLNHATKALSMKDLIAAKEQGLLSQSEATEVKILMAEAGLKKASSKQQSKAHEKSSYKK